ncbi:MAG: long-chain fatty acid--CoA ligase [Gammaproteobacteria bacterium]|nr:long-chain fatty acid--CoA ligase [Gammaproteobacteria bacterium]
MEVNLHAAAITSDIAVTIPGLFRERVKRSPDAIAYRYFDDKESLWKQSTWKEMGVEVARWQAALQKESLDKGDRVAVMAKNCREWVIFDQAALGLGLVLVPLYTQDRADNATYILKDCDAKLLVIGNQEQWSNLSQNPHSLDTVKRVVSIEEFDVANEAKFISLRNWLNENENGLISEECDDDELATIVYTSGTTGNPKGVMLSHRNIISNAYSGLRSVYITEEDLFLSFLPLSHTLERTIGYYLPMMSGATVAFARSIPDLAEDLLTIKPTCMISVPRIYERIYAKIKEGLAKKPKITRWLFNFTVETGWKRYEYKQGRAGYSFSILLWPLLELLVAKKLQGRFGGRLKGTICGGAPMPPSISRIFNALGVIIIQGYGLTETSPVITVNRIKHNIPASVGLVFPEIEVRIGDNDELLARGDNVMMGYWNCPEETSKTIVDGWLHSGDKARIENGYVYLTGRLKEIIVMANGEKVSPADMEMAIAQDALFEQVIIIGEVRPYLTAIVVLEKELWKRYAKKKGFAENDFSKPEVEDILLKRISRNLHNFPGYAQIRRMACVLEPWSIEQGLLTPTLKVKRPKVTEKFQQQIDSMYEGHTV